MFGSLAIRRSITKQHHPHQLPVYVFRWIRFWNWRARRAGSIIRSRHIFAAKIWFAYVAAMLSYGWSVPLCGLYGWRCFFCVHMEFAKRQSGFSSAYIYLAVKMRSYNVCLFFLFIFSKSHFGNCTCGKNEYKWTSLVAHLFVFFFFKCQSHNPHMNGYRAA